MARDAFVRRKFKKLKSPMLYHAGMVPAVGYGAELTAMPDLMLHAAKNLHGRVTAPRAART